LGEPAFDVRLRLEEWNALHVPDFLEKVGPILPVEGVPHLKTSKDEDP
jgi:hypothetical protein